MDGPGGDTERACLREGGHLVSVFMVKYLHVLLIPLISQHLPCPFLILCLGMVCSVVGCSFLLLPGALSFGGLWWKGSDTGVLAEC